MAQTVQLPSLRMWYADCGEGVPLVLLHGGFVDARYYDSNVDALATQFHVFTPDQRGHGHTPDVDGPFHYERLAQDLIEFIEAVVGAPAHLLGHSMGAIAALMVALRRPDLVRNLISVSGLYHYDGLTPGLTEQVTTEKVVAKFGPSYGEVSPDGEEHFPVIVRKIRDMGVDEPALTEADLGGVASRTLVMSADDDMTVLEHTISFYRSISNCDLAVMAGTSHRLLQEKPEECNSMIEQFLACDPAPTMDPIRRAPKPSAV